MITYDKLKADGKNFEILFISSDRSESSFTEYYDSMPGWFALPYKDKRCIQLTRLFCIHGRMLIMLTCIQCFDTVGWVIGMTISLNKNF